MKSISSTEKLAIDIDFTRCGGFSPRLFTPNATISYGKHISSQILSFSADLTGYKVSLLKVKISNILPREVATMTPT